MARVMSDTEIRRRKKVQGHISQVTGGLGLAGVGAFGAARLGGTSRVALKAQKAVPALKRINTKKADLGALGASTTAGGIGGAGSFNFAAYTGAESKKRQRPTTVGQPPSRVKKNEESQMDIGHYGEIGRPLKPEEIEKAWSPTGSTFDSEAKRQKRSKAYESGALVGAGAGGAYAAHQGSKAVGAARKIKPRDMAPVTPVKVKSGESRMAPHWEKPGHLLHEKAIPTRGLKEVARHGGKAALGVGAVAAAAGTSSAVRRKRKGSWQPYAKSALSPFGVDHQ